MQTTKAVFIVAALLLSPFVAIGQEQKDKKKTERKAGYSVTISGDIAPEFAPTVGRLTALFYECYPKLVERFEHPMKPAPRRIRLTFERNLPYPAFCTGTEIKINIDWLTKHPDDVGLLTHELTHAIQAYPRGEPGWITEGLADFARLKYGPKEQPGWSLPRRLTEKNSYRESYRVSARFFEWLDGKHPGAVDKIHRRMQDREYEPADFKVATGKALDELWNECVKELGKGSEKKIKPAPAGRPSP